MMKTKPAWPAPMALQKQNSTFPARKPVAVPPAFQPNATIQAKAPMSQARKQVTTPPVYRQQQATSIAQARSATPSGLASTQFRPPAAPPVFRATQSIRIAQNPIQARRSTPHATARVLQAASAQIGTTSTATQEYKLDTRTEEVRAARDDNDDSSGVNYATFHVTVNGVKDTVTENSSRYHSEKSCWLALCKAYPVFQHLKIKSWAPGNYGGSLTPTQLLSTHNAQITAVYTEREPCSGCAPLLYEIMLDPSQVSHSFIYPSKETKKFQHPPEQVALFSLLNLAPSTTGVSYTQTVNQHVREARVIGNKALKSAFR